MTDGTITTNDGRTVGFADYGHPEQIAVVWCHGGLGNRRTPEHLQPRGGRDQCAVGEDRRERTSTPLTTAVGACVIPFRRALRLDPATTLKGESIP